MNDRGNAPIIDELPAVHVHGMPASSVVWGRLATELERTAGLAEFVSHDLRGGLAVIVATTQPDMIRGSCSDADGLFDPEWVWHALAQGWQTPGDDEAFMALPGADGGKAP